MDAAQRLFHAAPARLVTALVGETGGEDDGPVERADDFERTDGARVPSQLVAPVGAVDGGQQAVARELLKHFGEQRQRDAVGVGDLLGAGAARGVARGQVLKCDQSVVGLLGELEHIGPNRSNIQSSGVRGLMSNRQTFCLQEIMRRGATSGSGWGGCFMTVRVMANAPPLGMKMGVRGNRGQPGPSLQRTAEAVPRLRAPASVGRLNYGNSQDRP